MSTVPLDRPLPIAVVIPSFHPGGTERQMIELMQRLDRRRWEVHLACFRREGVWFERAATSAASVAEFPIAGFARLATAVQMQAFSNWCRRHQIALVHTSDLYSNIFFLPGAALAGVPVRIGSRREIAAGKSGAQIAMQRAAYTCAHRIVTNADAVATRLRQEGIARHRVSVVPNGLEPSRFSCRELPQRLRRIAIVANLRPGKGHDTLIDAAPSVLRQFPDATFSVIGDGTERAALEQRARERGVAHAFTFAGHTDEVGGPLAEADIFTLPSDSEAFPNAVLEAMAAGLPVVATSVGGIREVVEDGRTGVLVPPRRPQALADALCRLLASPGAARSLAAAGRALVETRYSFDRMVASIEQIYDHELTRRALGRAVPSSLAAL